MEFYESTYFIVLVPSVVITVIFLFFWLFMKETSYDEVLAKQKKDQKPPPVKIEKKKTDKKKNKKKEVQNGNLHESDSETAMRDFDLVDALSSEEEHVVPTPVVSPESFGNIRERKKKDKKPSKPIEDQAIKEINGTKLPSKKPEPVPVTKQPTPPPPPDTGVSKKKAGQKKQKNGRDDSPLSPETKNEQVVPSSKKQEPLSLPVEVKPQESGAGGKKKSSVKKQKVETVSGLVDEPLIQATVYIPLMDNSEVNVVEKKEPANLEKLELPENLPKSSGKKMKIVTDKENSEVKFKDFLLTLRNMVFTEEEALSLVDALKAKSNAVQDIVHKVSILHDQLFPTKLLFAFMFLFTLSKLETFDELVAEKQKLNLVEAKARERITLLEKEHGVYQSKMHSSYQEAQQMQLKFQQVREQMDNQISHLKQENTILRDAVSSATNQMESKQSSELNKLRQDYARLMSELTEKNNRVAQEELQKKTSEQAVVQLKSQMQEADRNWKEMEKYLRARVTESEGAQQELQAKLINKDSEVQSLHSKLTDTMVSKQQLEQKIMQFMDAGQGDSLQDLVKQNEALNAQVQKLHTQIAAQSSVIVEEMQKTIAEKDKEIKQMSDTLAFEHANFANSGEELKELLKENEALKAQVQKYHTQIATQHFALCFCRVAEKDKEIKQVQDSLSLEHANFSNSKEELKAVQRENVALKSELQSLHTAKDEKVMLANSLEQMKRSVMEKDEQIRKLDGKLNTELAKVSSNIEDFKANKDALGQLEKSMQEKDEKIKTVEELLETGLIQLANKEAELRAIRDENESLRSGLKALQEQQSAQVHITYLFKIHEKEGTIKSVQDLLQAEQRKANSHEANVTALNQEIKSLKEALGNSQLEKAEQISKGAQVQELQNELRSKEESLKNIEMRFKEREKDIADRERQIQDLDKECKVLKAHTEEVRKQLQQRESASSQAANLQSRLAEQQEKVRNIEAILLEKEKSVNDKSQELQTLRAENNVLRVQACELQQKHEQLAEKDRHIRELQSELESLRSAVEQQRKKNNDLREKNWKAMEALASTEKMLQERMNKTAKEQQQLAQTAETQARQVLQKLFPGVSVSAGLCHGDWVQEFEKGARNCLNESAGAEKVKVLEQKLKEGEEIHTMLQLECEKYKSVLAETEGILQRLQRSVEEEEGRWKLKVDDSQQELNEVSMLPTLRKALDHLESELEKAETERTTYVSEVRELKTQLNETLLKLEEEQSERQKVASDLHEAQKSLDLIQLEILKDSGDSNVIENSDISPEMEEQEKKEKIMPSLSQTVTKLQQCLQAVNQQLTKGREHFQIIGMNGILNYNKKYLDE
uniref:Kinectin 1 n=1 Tax=Xenopus tropicalis TaxID=8364 RepID=A0A6I8RYW1_XENTR